MTTAPYPEIPDDGIDVTHLLGTSPTTSDKADFQRYQDAFNIAVYWPCVEHFRACVKAYDEMIRPAGDSDGTHPID